MTVKSLYPTVLPSLNLDFANSKKLDPRVTFTRASVGTFVNENGLIATAASGAARFDHDPVTGKCLGLLVEEARTNFFENSVFSVFSDWQNNDKGTLVANAAVSPDGTSTAAEYTQSAQYDPAIYLGFAQSSPLVFSCFVKPVNGDIWSIGTLAWNSYGVGTYTFSTQQWSGPGLPQLENYGVEELANGWYRLWVALNATATGGNTVYVSCNDADISGVQGYLWGCELSTGSFPTSYIPTVASTVTRAADVASITGTNFSSWYRQGQGSFMATATRLNGLPVSQFTVLTTDGFRLPEFLFDSSGNGKIFNNLTGAYASPTPLLTAKFGAAFDGAGISRFINGVGDSTASTSLVDSNTVLYLGNWLNNATLYRLSGTIARIAYYPARLPDAQLQALTAT